MTSTVRARLLLISVFALLLPSAASALVPSATRPSERAEFSVPISLFTVRGSSGYMITVYGAAGGPGRSTVGLSAAHGTASATYTTEGTVTAEKMEASFGPLGALALRFRSSGRVIQTMVPPGCRVNGFPSVARARLGTFTGTLWFRGERGYTKVSTHRIKGRVGEPRAILGGRGHPCLSPGSGANEASGVLLAASRPTREASFGATAEPPSDAPQAAASPAARADGLGSYRFDGSTLEQRSGVEIARSAAATGPAGDFIFDSTLSSATVTPPPPFSGSATFQRNPGGSAGWTGSLSVSLPGLPRVRLAGPRFRSSMQSF